MKKVLVGLLIFALLSPIPANGFFNRDCKNLTKRTTVNQAKYEKAWDKYQTVLANWVNTGQKLSGESVVRSRLQQVGNVQLVILDDFFANRKCLITSNLSEFANAKILINAAMRQSLWGMDNFPFSQVVDWTRYVKK